MNEKENRTIEIDLDEYNILMISKHKYHALLDALMNATELRYGGPQLAFKGYEAEEALKILEPKVYKWKLDDLIKEKEKAAQEAAAEREDTTVNPL